MALTNQGFDARRFTDIRQEMFEEMANNLAIELDTSPDQVLSIITNIFSSSVADIEELAQAVADNFNIDKAEGKYLDDLVALIKLKRLGESFTTGIIHVKSNAISSSIAAGNVFSDTQGNQYTNTIAAPVSNLSATNVEIRPTDSSGIFSITIDGTTYSVTYQNSTPAAAIVTGLYNEIINTAPTKFTLGFPSSTSLNIELIDKSNTFSVVPNPNLQVEEVEVPVVVTATQVGQIDPEIGTVTNNVSNITGLQSVTNYFKFSVGREKETDEELRARHSSSTQISGNATASAMFAKLSNIIGVSQVRVFENKSGTTNASGLPPKSFECIVQGGDGQTIGETIYDTMPLGVETYGEITTIVKDYAGNNEAVMWSRPTLRYINVKVTFDAYDEETFPDDGVQTIKDTIVSVGESLTLDEDVIPQRFLGHIYNAVNGIAEMTVEVGTSVNPASPTPDEVQYSTDRIAIDGRTKADFDAIRIQVVQQ